MSEINAAVEVFTQPAALLSVISSLCAAGFDPRKLSVVGLYFRLERAVPGATCLEGGPVSATEAGTFWDAVRILQPRRFFQTPNLGAVHVAGPLACWIDAALSKQALFGGLSPVGAGLCSIGIPRSIIPFYEADLKAGRFLLIAHGSTRDVEWARSLIDNVLHRGELDATTSSSQQNGRN